MRERGLLRGALQSMSNSGNRSRKEKEQLCRGRDSIFSSVISFLKIKEIVGHVFKLKATNDDMIGFLKFLIQ